LLRRGLVVALALGPLAGCRACGDETRADGAAQPPMPSGMLVPSPASSPAASPATSLELAPPLASVRWPGPPAVPIAGILARLRVSGTPSISAFELAPVGEGEARSLWVRPLAMTLLENAFARAQPGFGPFASRVVTPASMPKLGEELAALRVEWLALPNAEAARAKFRAIDDALREEGGNDAWRDAQATFAMTLEILAKHVADLASKGMGLRVSAGR
jgi:hypothetical protein